jgi:hypothetical protein
MENSLSPMRLASAPVAAMFPAAREARDVVSNPTASPAEARRVPFLSTRKTTFPEAEISLAHRRKDTIPPLKEKAASPRLVLHFIITVTYREDSTECAGNVRVRRSRRRRGGAVR